ncbi:MAG: hypothetical protein Kow0074_08410 [Candidatus Zixiibacteriota bacterium]
MLRRVTAAFVVTVILSLTTGCSDDETPTGGDGNGGGNEDVSFATQVLPIFTATCAVSGCHNAATAQEGLVLDAGNAYDNIVDIASSQNPSIKRVNPGDPDNSYLVMKIEGTAPGDRMPRGRPALSAAQIQLIRDWIEQGALDN